MKVLLMVQGEYDKAPKFGGLVTTRVLSIFKTPQAWAEEMASYYPRWWLVEAKSAAHARMAISLWKSSGGLRTKFNDDVFVDAGSIELHGRILASGGKR